MSWDFSTSEGYFSNSEDDFLNERVTFTITIDLLDFPWEYVKTTELEKSGLTASSLRGRRNDFTAWNFLWNGKKKDRPFQKIQSLDVLSNVWLSSKHG